MNQDLLNTTALHNPHLRLLATVEASQRLQTMHATLDDNLVPRENRLLSIASHPAARAVAEQLRAKLS